MAIIIETCPKCGHDLVDEVICTNPPIPKKSCWNCGWHWEGEPEEVVRVPFGGNSYAFEKGASLAIDNLATTVSNYYGNTINAIEAMEAFAKTVEEYSNKLSEGLEEYNDNLIKDSLISNFEQSACINCPSNPKNGGDGICFCTLGQMNVVY